MMDEKEEIKGVLYRLKTFFWYLGTEPFRQLRYIIGAFNRTVTWMYIFSLLFIIFLFIKSKYYSGFFLVATLLMALLWEWQSGFYIHRHRQVIKQKIRKQMEEEKNDSSDGFHQ